MQQNGEIEKHTPVLDVIKVIFDGLVNDEFAIATQLPQSSKTLGNGEAAAFEWSICIGDLGHLRSRPHQRHLAKPHIEQLWQFIQAGFS